MVEERPLPDSQREHAGGGHWFRRLTVGALTLAAVVNQLLTQHAARRATPPCTDPVHPEDEEIIHSDGRIEHPSVGYERTDASFPAVLVLLIIAAGWGIIQFSIIRWFYYDYESYQATIKQSSFPLAASPTELLPATPRLEQLDRLTGIATSDVYVREVNKEAVLHSFGATKEKGYVHIPIEQALNLLADKLPVRQEPAKHSEKSNGLVNSGASNSGRLFRGKPE